MLSVPEVIWVEPPHVERCSLAEDGVFVDNVLLHDHIVVVEQRLIRGKIHAFNQFEVEILRVDRQIDLASVNHHVLWWVPVPLPIISDPDFLFLAWAPLDLGFDIAPYPHVRQVLVDERVIRLRTHCVEVP